MVETVAEIGELEVIARVTRHLRPATHAVIGPGDDCAVLDTSGRIAVTSDTMIEGPDFRLDWHAGEKLGWKLAATNLSDLASMGALPVALTVSIACPASTPVALLEEIARGLQEACDALSPGCAVVGGDLASAKQLVCAVTAIGDQAGIEPVTRTGAQVGDVVAYAGELGLSGIGLRALYESGSQAINTHPVETRAHLTPRPPIALGRAAAMSGATAMLDVSDGLSLDAARIGRASGVTIDFSREQLRSAFGDQSGVRVSVNDMLTGGEDHGLLATFASNTTLPDGFHPIGVVRPHGADLLLDGEPISPSGWDSITGDQTA